jgi:hypothetical protein
MIATSADSLCRRVASKGVYFQSQETAKIELLSFEMPIRLPHANYSYRVANSTLHLRAALRKSAAISVDIDEYFLFKNSIHDGI